MNIKSTQLTSTIFVIVIFFITLLTGCSKDTDKEMQPKIAEKNLQVIRKNFTTRQELDNYLKRPKKFSIVDTITKQTIISSSTIGELSSSKSSSSTEILSSSGNMSRYIVDENYQDFMNGPIAWTFNFPSLAMDGYPSRLLCNGLFSQGGGTFYNALFMASEVFPGPSSSISNNWTTVYPGTNWIIFSNHSFMQELTVGPVVVSRKSYSVGVTIAPLTSQPNKVKAVITFEEITT